MVAVVQPNSTIGGPGNLLRPNRAGLAAMSNATDIPGLQPSVTVSVLIRKEMKFL
jgi:hypothetical protein